MRYLFPFVTYLQADGSFSPSYNHAAEFVSQFRRFSTDTLLLAWIGVPLEKRGPLGIDGWVDLTDERVRLIVPMTLLNYHLRRYPVPPAPAATA